MDHRKTGLQRWPDRMLKRRIRRLVPTRKDSLLRFGAELVLALCELQGVEIVSIHKGDPPSFEEEPARDVLAIITVFSARRYGSRSPRSRKLIASLKEAQAQA